MIGCWCCSYILNEVMRERWNQPNAFVSTDCGAVSNLMGPPVRAPTPQHAVAYSINNGTDIEMGSTLWTDGMVTTTTTTTTTIHTMLSRLFQASAVKEGLVTEDTITKSLSRSLHLLFRAGRFDPVDSVEWTDIGTEYINSTEHQQIQYEAALQSLVLLKNDNLLPLKPGINIAVIGPQVTTLTTITTAANYEAKCMCYI